MDEAGLVEILKWSARLFFNRQYNLRIQWGSFGDELIREFFLKPNPIMIRHGVIWNGWKGFKSYTRYVLHNLYKKNGGVRDIFGIKPLFWLISYSLALFKLSSRTFHRNIWIDNSSRKIQQKIALNKYGVNLIKFNQLSYPSEK